MPLTPLEVENLARLAHLTLTPEDREKYQDQLSSVLSYIGKLREVDVTGVVPTAQTTGLTNVWRADKLSPADAGARDLIVRAFPEHGRDDLLSVPGVLV